MRRALLVTLVLASLAGCAAPAPPVHVPTGQIDGAILSNLLQPFAAQPVYIVQLGVRDDSSPLGGFTFRNVPVGTYTLLSSLDGYRSAAAVVDVEEDRITKVILQLIPIPEPEPYFVTVPHQGEKDVAVPGDACKSCSWSIPIEGAPKEVILDATWTRGTPLNAAKVEFTVKDNLGFTFADGLTGDSPMRISISGDDIREEATSLEVTVRFSWDFTHQTRFRMDEVATFYYGATHDDLFYV